ncbi:MAG: UDP-N-acetylglucosamine--N-acetylmuramyl-(pentapeptide) pyrophosphoryl-undecaprenol N-acetylglucosamine transferase [Parcubacteria group bacterium]|nr:UDP-N-acetylglucosamine--N-acetylmuramyl-(pentapeptide) pyrophosphoryl-undecaprenol N-acetylglucosamine transferase [Parcubacteria group bacterium]
MNILLAGGGTLGSVNPLIAVYEEAKRRQSDWGWFWVGTRRGPERAAVKKLGIGYEWIPQAKFRRYASFHMLLDPFYLVLAFLRGLFIMAQVRPDVVVGAGSFVSVPIVWAAWLFRKKILIHQQDVRPSLSNVLAAPFADRITASFAPSLEAFSKKKSELTGNPVRAFISEGMAERARHMLNLDPSVRTVLILGGSSGAAKLNQWVWEHCDALGKRANIIHITGRAKSNPAVEAHRYHQIEFVAEELPDMLAAADLVVSRAGIATLSELSHLAKPTILVPISRSHQIDTAAYVARMDAAYVVREEQMDERLGSEILELLESPDERKKLGGRMGSVMEREAARRIVQIIEHMTR